MSSPVVVRVGSDLRIYWGDIHSHAADSFDGIGGRPFEHAREVSCLDFYALTEHAEGWADETWERIGAAVTAHHRDGEFVTLRAYEATFPAPWGHHNVYFRGDDGPVRSALHGTLPDLWAALGEGHALTVPHHTGVEFRRPAPGGGYVAARPVAIDWSHHHAGLRRLTEIYSAHGQCERFDRNDPLAYERSDFQFNASVEGPHYAQDAWRLGHRLGTVASSDDHHGHPGRGEYGLTALRSERLSRGAIFDALLARSCYATTGARIFVEFTAAGAAIGQETRWAGPIPLRLRVHGTGELAAVEVVRLAPASPEAVVARWAPRSWDLTAEATDRPAGSLVMYYVRVRQAGLYRGRAIHAWTSPIWIELDDG